MKRRASEDDGYAAAVAEYKLASDRLARARENVSSCRQELDRAERRERNEDHLRNLARCKLAILRLLRRGLVAYSLDRIALPSIVGVCKVHVSGIKAKHVFSKDRGEAEDDVDSWDFTEAKVSPESCLGHPVPGIVEFLKKNEEDLEWHCTEEYGNDVCGLDGSWDDPAYTFATATVDVYVYIPDQLPADTVPHVE
jgi:hypothetical protein